METEMGVRIARCRFCGGSRRAGTGDGRPRGWYSLSVSVPPEMGKNGQPFLWAGMWCSAACLAADMPRIIEQEHLARLAYEPDLPYPPGSAEASELAAIQRTRNVDRP